MSIHLKSLHRTFAGAHVAVDGVTLDIDAGEFFVVLGPSGCGKTTLLRLIAGLETPDDGEIAIGGRPVFGASLNEPPEQRNVGVVFQSYALWPHMSVRDNVSFPIETRGADRLQRRELADRCLETVALTPFADRKPAALSGGQRQRVALARCLAQQAKTILMDEPLANLDPHLRSAMEDELSAFHRDNGTTTLFITHDQREAMALADRIAVMWEGRMLQVDAPDNIYSQPSSERVARFIGRSSIAPCEVEAVDGRKARVALGGHRFDADCPAQAAAGSARVLLRPENIAPTSDGTGLPARVSRSTYRGGYWETEAVCEGLTERLIVNLPAKAAAGEALRLAVKAAWLLDASDQVKGPGPIGDL